MENKFILLYQEYYDSITSLLSTLSMQEWILISFAFIAILTKVPFLVLVPLSAFSYLALENEAVGEKITELVPNVSLDLLVLGSWIVVLFFRCMVFKKENNYKNPKLIKNLVSFSFIFILSLAIGTPSFENSPFNDFKTIIMFGIILYALFHIFVHSIGLLKNVVITFAWTLIISIIGMQANPEKFKEIFNEDVIQKFSKLQEVDIKKEVKNLDNISFYVKNTKL